MDVIVVAIVAVASVTFFAVYAFKSTVRMIINNSEASKQHMNAMFQQLTGSPLLMGEPPHPARQHPPDKGVPDLRPVFDEDTGEYVLVEPLEKDS